MSLCIYKVFFGLNLLIHFHVCLLFICAYSSTLSYNLRFHSWFKFLNSVPAHVVAYAVEAQNEVLSKASFSVHYSYYVETDRYLQVNVNSLYLNPVASQI